jgi:hypothetical protein
MSGFPQPKKYKTEEEYHEATSRHMVHESGKMPYDHRLTDDTFVPDNYVPKKDKIQFVEIFEEPTNKEENSYEVKMLDHEWQKEWFKENGPLNIRIQRRKSDGSEDDTILEQIRKYRNDLGEFRRSEEYRNAADLMMEKHREASRLFNKRNTIRDALSNKKLTHISEDDARELGWIIEDDPTYKIYTSSRTGNKYVRANEFRETWTGEKKPLSKSTIWLGDNTQINNTTGGKKRKVKKITRKNKRKSKKSNKRFRKTKKYKKSNKK